MFNIKDFRLSIYKVILFWAIVIKQEKKSQVLLSKTTKN